MLVQALERQQHLLQPAVGVIAIDIRDRGRRHGPNREKRRGPRRTGARDRGKAA